MYLSNILYELYLILSVQSDQNNNNKFSSKINIQQFFFLCTDFILKKNIFRLIGIYPITNEQHSFPMA